MYKLGCALIFSVALAFAADVSGTWQFAVETNQGTGSPTVTFAQKGEQLAGTYNSQNLGEAKITGSVKGSVIQFAIEADVGGQKIKVTYKGTVESATTMKGTAVLEGIDDKATWTATKK